jgi:hypothetical protein
LSSQPDTGDVSLPALIALSTCQTKTFYEEESFCQSAERRLAQHFVT